MKKQKHGILHMVGGIAFTAGMCIIMPKLIEKGSDFLYNKTRSSKKQQDEDDWGPEIVRKTDLEEEQHGGL